MNPRGDPIDRPHAESGKRQSEEKRMQSSQKIRVRVWDQMVLIGIGLALFYTVFESVLFIFLQVDVDFMQRLFGPGMSAIWGRMTIVCLFAIFGSHAQYTINQRKMAEFALRESEERFRRIIENSPVGYFELDLQDNFTFFNDASCEILGFSRKELENQKHFEVVDTSSKEKLAEALERVMVTGETAKSVDWILVRRDGTRRFSESSVSLLRGAKNRPVGFSIFLRDVTERKRSEALMRAKLAAEAASRTKGEFLASMSHEIRTPLNAIIGLVELLLGTDLRPDQSEDLDVVKSSAYALLSIINNVLDFSKIEAGKIELEKTAFKLENFLDESLKILAMKAHDKGLELAYRMAPEAPDQLVGDPTRLRQVLLNLVDNALKFTDRGEVIVNVTVRARQEERVTLQFMVTDTGVGISTEKQRRIFQAYDQGGTDVSRRYGGTGLGLAVSAQLVRLMGGAIGVRSTPGRGSTFAFTAVFGCPQAPQKSFAPREPHPLRGRVVLMVDDNESTCRIVGEVLRRHSMVPRCVASAEEAGRVLNSEKDHPGLLLVDSDLPGEDGFSLVRRLQELNGFSTPVIMMLTFAHLKRKAESAALGVPAVLIKPFGPTELLRTIGRSLDQGPPRLHDYPLKKAESYPLRFSRPLRVLVVEDTPFNQKFILRLLERWGVAAELAENGRSALEAFSREPFDLVLMDVQMPVMDGLEASRAIRRMEADAGGRTPIIAMTAHAIKGDREQCLEAGMDDYISKPIDAENLHQMMERLVAPARASGPTDPKPLPSPAASLLAAFDHDWGFFKEVTEVFLDDTPHQLEALRRSFKEADASGLRRAAHSLRGMLRNFQADAAADKALALEKKGQAQDLTGALPLIEEIADDVAELKRGLRKILDEGPSN